MNLKTLHKISYGLYVICSYDEDKKNGQIANAIFQVTSEPPTVAISINKQNLTHEYIDKSNKFSISILSDETPLKYIGNFGFKSGRDIDKLEGVNYKCEKTKCPIVLEYSIGFIECNVIKKIDVGTHTIFIANVINADILTDNNPMTYEFYHKVKGGFSPKTAPTYYKEVDKETKKEEKKMEIYICEVCGYRYEPKKGDPDNGIEPGTSFEDLPDNWTCPVCGAGKGSFKKE
jgi:flavin reductase (DIM6/NTAB) family NADH-FMN oxidoreductase RutF/rubredoxin